MFDGDRMLSKLEAFLETEEGQRSLQEYVDKISTQYEIRDMQLERFHAKHGKDVDRVIKAVLVKYNSESYVERWYKRHIEPPETFLWFLFDYAKKYGEEIDHRNLALIDSLSMFTTEAYTIDGWLFERLDGQGSIIKCTQIQNI